jgi:restriction system protein
MDKPKRAWMVRAGNDNILANTVYPNNAVAIGWDEMGDLAKLKTRDDFKIRYREVYPDDAPGRLMVNVGQLYRFVYEIQSGDYVVTYIKDSREVLIGIAEGDYKYDPNLFDKEYPQIRRVKWLKKVSRDVFSPAARNTLGSILTVFQLDNIYDEIDAVATQKGKEAILPEEVIEEAPPFYQEVRAKADELVADLISRLDPYDFQDLVAAVLEAMGFQAKSSPPGRDRGVDIIAHPDAFGFEKPRIKVQVKHRKGPATGPEMRSFMGVLSMGENGLFVSTGGFTHDATIEAERSREPVKLLDRDDFIQLLLENYEALAAEFKARVPLVKVWLPTE